MRIKHILISCVLLCVTIQTSFADIVSEISVKYSTILDRYQSEQTAENFQNFLTRIDNKINERLQDTTTSDLKRSLYIALRTENAKRKNISSTISIGENTSIRTLNSTKRTTSTSISKTFTSDKVSLFRNQSIIEDTIRTALKEELLVQEKNTILQAFKDAGYRVYSTNSRFEFVENNDIKNINFTKYVRVTEGNYKGLLLRDKISKIGDEIIYDGQSYYIPTSGISIETKNAYSRSQNLFKDSINHEENYVKKGETYYTYDYDSFLFFKDKYGFYSRDLTNSNIDIDTSILLAEGGGMKIVRDYSEERLIASNLISRVSDQAGFLSVVVKDADYTQQQNNDSSFQRLKDITESITEGKSRDGKIEAIYDFVLDNHYYYEEFGDGNEDIFSGIDTFRNGYGVCDGYSKLMYYMLNFAGIKDIEHIRGYVFDAVDFPEIGHAWVRIGSRYYDPTFDDPIGGVSTLRKDQYRYFELPKDVAYTNRLDGFNASDELRKMSLANRKKLVEQNLFALLGKYEPGTYNLLGAFQVKEDLGFIAGETITLSKLEKKLTFYEVAPDNSYVDEFGTTKYIRSLEFYRPTDGNINGIISTLGTDFADAVLLKWPLNNGSFEYRLAYVFESR